MSTSETYTRHRATSDRLIARYGGSAVLVQKGEKTGPAHAPVTGPDLLIPVQYIESGYEVGLRDGTLTQAGDVIGVMAVPDGFVPKPLDKLRIRSVDHTFVDLKPVQPSPDAPVLQFAFQARR